MPQFMGVSQHAAQNGTVTPYGKHGSLVNRITLLVRHELAHEDAERLQEIEDEVRFAAIAEGRRVVACEMYLAVEQDPKLQNTELAQELTNARLNNQAYNQEWG